MNRPLVWGLSRQWHRPVAMSGKDNRWKHLSGKPTPRLGIVIGPWEMITLIGARWKCCKALSRGVLIPRQNSWKELWESRPTHAERVDGNNAFFVDSRFFVSYAASVSWRVERCSLVLCRRGEARVRAAPQGRSTTVRGGVAGFASRQKPVTHPFSSRIRFVLSVLVIRRRGHTRSLSEHGS